MKTTGKMILDGQTCNHCDNQILNGGLKETNKCSNCGAQYKLNRYEITKDDEFEIYFDFLGFVCVEGSYFNNCYNTCPAPHMYCRDHSSEEAEQKVKREIQGAQNNLEKTKEKLDLILESRRKWLIMKLGGVE